MSMNRLFILLARAGATLALLAAVASPALAQAPRLTLRADDHVVLIGSAVADRMQHSGHFEALVHVAFPDLRLVFRNLAVAGDEVAVRHRSENFGSPDDWLIRTRADVILAFFGANESAAGPEGLPKFRADLAKFLQETRQKNYSDKGFPRVVLFSPIAQERHPDPNYADPTAANARLQAYTAAMAEVARANGVPFVDLFAATTRLYAQAAGRGQPLTWNGFFLTDAGDRALAPVIFQDLFGQPAPAFNIEKLRLAVNEKNAQWHQRYRTIDGYNVYGGRSALAYQEGKGAFISDRNAPAPYLSNYKVLQEEMSVRDALTANRD
ncbi:MAG: SGNH/GDSL hydrolase family protein, partial [Verrucomicrobiota bacterium]